MQNLCEFFFKTLISSAKMAPEVGLEPTLEGVSSLLIVAFLCGILPVYIRQVSSVCKLFVASSSNIEQENLCGTVRLPARCAGTVRGSFSVR